MERRERFAGMVAFCGVLAGCTASSTTGPDASVIESGSPLVADAGDGDAPRVGSDTGSVDAGLCEPVSDYCVVTDPAREACIVGGWFERGDASRPDASPSSTVFVQTFVIERTEVTVEDFRRCVASGECSLPMLEAALAHYRSDANLGRPVLGLTLEQMEDYCRYRAMRLPTEAEWEFAARGSSNRTYPWGAAAPSCETTLALCAAGPSDAGGSPQDVTPEGVSDLLGNVAEATADRWESGGYASYSDDVCAPAHPLRTAMDEAYVARGCAWNDAAADCTATTRRAALRVSVPVRALSSPSLS